MTFLTLLKIHAPISLTSLSVLWALVRHGRAKGMIVCPSSLVRHWEKEIVRWLPQSLGRTALYATASTSSSASKNSADSIVGRFVCDPPEVSPLLVISYELYRCVVSSYCTIHPLGPVLTYDIFVSTDVLHNAPSFYRTFAGVFRSL